MKDNCRLMRTIESAFTTRETSNDGSNPEETEKRIEGYFAVFDGTYEIAPGLTESVAPEAFDETITGDIRALTDHDTTLVLGRTAAHTLELRRDSHGLWGSVLINPNDQDAMNLYARVQRGDVNQCSFGFDILDEDTEIRENGDIHWTIRKVKLYEVSVCTFPAYETTDVSARSKEAKEIRKKTFDAWKLRQQEAHGWLKKGESEANGKAEDIAAPEED